MSLPLDTSSDALLVELFHRLEHLEARVKEQSTKLDQQELALRVIAQLPADEVNKSADTVPLVDSHAKTPPTIAPPAPRIVPPQPDSSPLLLAALNATEQALIGLDAERHICLWNQAASQLFGWSQLEVMGCSLPFVPLDQADDLAEYLDDASRGEPQSPLEFELLNSSGQRKAIRLSAKAGPDGGLVLLLSPAYARLTTARELSSQQQRFVSVGRVVAGVAHDLNNLLSITQGNAELLAKQLAGLPAFTRLVDDVLQTSSAATDICRQLTAVVRPEPGLGPRCELASVLHKMRPVLQAVLGQTNRLAIQVPNASAIVGLSSADVLQLMLNLVTNSRAALENQFAGLVEIQLMVLNEPQPEVQLMVLDNGTGMQPEKLQTLLQEGDNMPLIGLGFATVRQLVHDAGGRLEVESELGHGTSVRIVLPRA